MKRFLVKGIILAVTLLTFIGIHGACIVYFYQPELPRQNPLM